MSRLVIFIVLLNLSLTNFAQIKISRGSLTEINKFLNSKTYIVLNKELMSDYNDKMKEAIAKHWTITDYEFISETEFKNHKSDPKKSFLMVNQVYFEKDKTRTLFDFLILTLGGNYKTVNDMPSLCAIPLCYHGALEEAYAYKLGLMIKFVQLHINTCKENPSISEDKLADYYMQKTASPKTKTLYLLKEEVAPEIRTKNSFASVYPFNFEYSDKEKIKNLINNNDEDAIILHLLGPQTSNTLSYCIKIIIDTEKGNIYYYDMHKLTNKNSDRLLKSDLKKLSNKK